MPEKMAGQNFAVRVLKSHIAKDRLAHTYLLTGKNESESAKLALDFAKALLCEQNKVFESCDCTSCRKIENQNHPDVRWLGQDTDARSIKIEAVREMLGWANLKPYEGRRKVFIFIDAERLTPEAQNALLKTLEEPPGQTIFCLLVESKSHLLETIQSRSFEIRLPSKLDDTAEGEIPAGLGEKKWDDFLEPYQTTTREEVKSMLDAVMNYFRDCIARHSEDPERSEGDEESGSFATLRMTALLDALDAAYETKEALEANANQKLALTRLTMRLKKILSE